MSSPSRSKYANSAEAEVQAYLDQVRQGQAGQDPQAQTLARSTSNPGAQRLGQRMMADRTSDNLANIEDAKRESERAAKQAERDAAKMAKEQARADEAARARDVRAQAAQGAKTITDIETGKRTIATHPDGATVFESGPISPVKPLGEVGQTLQDTQTGEKRDVPNMGVMLGDNGGALGASGTERQTVFGQEVRDNRGNVSVVPPKTETDAKTGQITYEQKNETTGRTEKLPAGIDWNTRELAARKQQNAADEQAAALEANAAAQARAAFEPQWTDAEKKFKAAASLRESLYKEPFRRNGAGQWEKYDPQTGATQYTTPYEVANYQERLRDAETQFQNASEKYHPLAAQNEQITKAEKTAELKRLKAREERERIALGIPTEATETLTRILVSGSSDVITPEKEAAEQIKRAAEVAPTSQNSTQNHPKSVANTITQSGAVPAPDTPETRDAFQSISGLAGVTTKNEGPYTTLHRNGQWIASLETADAHPAITLRDAAANDADVMQIVRQTNGGIPVFLKDNPERPKVTDEAKTVANVIAAMNSPEAANPDVAAQIKDYSTIKVRKMVANGTMSVQSGEAILRTMGDSLKVEDWRDPAAFQKWLETSSAKDNADLNAKYGRTDLTAQGTAKQRMESAQSASGRDRGEALQVKLDFVRDWALKNAGKPGVSRQEIAQAYASQDPGISKLDPLNAGHSLVTIARDSVIASMIGMAGGAAADLGAAEMALFGNKDAAATLKEDIQLRNRDFANWTNAAKRNAKVWATKDGQAAMSKLDTSLAVLKNAIDQEADAQTPDKARIDAAESGVRQAALALHNLAPDENWPMTLDTLDANKDTALGSSLADYMATGDPRSFELYRERLLMNNGRRQYSADLQQKLGANKSGFFGAMTSAQYAGWQEIGSELVADAAMLATGGIAKGLQVGLKAAGATGKASQIAKLSAAMGRGLEAVEKFGVVEGTLQKPLTVAQKFRNAGMKELKAAAGEGGEEVIVEPGSDTPQIADAFLGGFVAPLGIIPAQVAAHQMAKTATGPIDEKAEAQRSQKWASQFNAAMAGTPGFTAVTPEQAKVAANFVDPKQYLVTTQSIANAMDNLQAVQGDTEADTARKGQLRAGLNELSGKLAKQTADAVAAAQAVDSIADPQQKTFFSGIAKVATSNIPMMTQAERSAVQGRTTREGAPYFAQVAMPDGTMREVLTDEARAEVMADMPAVGSLITTPESVAIFEAQTSAAAQPQTTAPNGQNLQGQPGSQAAPQTAPPALANPNAPGGPIPTATGQAGNAGGTGAPTPEAVASYAASDAAIYTAAREANPALPSIPDVVAAARAAGQPVSPSMAKVADEQAQSQPEQPQEQPAPQEKPAPSAQDIESEIAKGNPVNAAAADAAGVKIPENYHRVGENYRQKDAAATRPIITEQFKKAAASLANKIKSDIEAMLPGIKGRIKITDRQDIPVTGGVFADTDGTISLHVSDVALRINEIGEKAAAEELTALAIQHELRHVAQVEVVRDAWEKAKSEGYTGSFNAFWKSYYKDIYAELLKTPKVIEFFKEIYDAKPVDQKGFSSWDQIDTEENRAAEGVRILLEIAADGTADQKSKLSELIRANIRKDSKAAAFLEAVIAKLRELLGSITGEDSNLSEKVKAHIEEVAAFYDELLGKTPEISEDLADARAVAMQAVRDAKSSNPIIKANDNLRIDLENVAWDLGEVLAGMPQDQRKAFVDSAIADWLESNAETIRQSAEDAAQAEQDAGKPATAREKAKAAREAYQARIRAKAREILNSGDFSVLSAIFDKGTITPKPNAIALMLKRKKDGKKLTEKEMDLLRPHSEGGHWDGMPRKQDYPGGGNNVVVRAIIDAIMAPQGKGEMPHEMASAIGQKGIGKASEMWDAVYKELESISRGQALGIEDPDMQETPENIAKAEAERVAQPATMASVLDEARGEFGNDHPVTRKAELFTTYADRLTPEMEDVLIYAMQAEMGRARAGVISPIKWQEMTNGWTDVLKDVHRKIAGNTPESLEAWLKAQPVIEEEAPMFSSAAVPAFYSQLARTIEAKMPKMAPPAQVIQIATSGAKAEEIKWSGLVQKSQELAQENGGKVPKDALLEWLANEGSVRFEEVMMQGSHGYSIIAPDGSVYEYGIDEERADVVSRRLSRETGETYTVREDTKPTKFSQYTLPGGENYREVVLAMPESPKSKAAEIARLEKDVADAKANVKRIEDQMPERLSAVDARIEKQRQQGNTNVWGLEAKRRNITNELVTANNLLKAREEALERKRGESSSTVKGKTSESYESSHFPDVPNYVAHMRLNERGDGLFIEELQSDRHQAGREEGYQVTRQTVGDLKLVSSGSIATGDKKWTFEDANGDTIGTFLADTEVNAREKALSALQRETDLSSTVGVPDAPYRKDWPLALFKRALRDAVAGGKNWIGWTVGQVHTDRWGTERIEWAKQHDGSWLVNAKSQHGGNAGGIDLEGEANARNLNKQNSATVRTLEELKSTIAPALTEGQDVNKLGPKLWNRMQAEASGVSHPRKEGFEAFYDSAGEFGGMVKEIGKYVKQWGAKVEKSEIADADALETESFADFMARTGLSDADARPRYMQERRSVSPSGTPIWRIDITDAMREGVESGQTLFSSAPNPDFQKIREDITEKLTKSPNQHTYEPTSERRPEINKFLKDNGLFPVSPTDLGIETNDIDRVSGSEIVFVRKRTPGGFVSTNSLSIPRLIAIDSQTDQQSIGYMIAHEMVHVAQKSSNAPSGPILKTIGSLVSQEELQVLKAHLIRNGYQDIPQVITAEIHAHLVADAVAGTNTLGLQFLSNRNELAKELVSYFESLPRLEPDARPGQLFAEAIQKSREAAASSQSPSSAPQQPDQPDLFAAATAPDAAQKLGDVKVGRMNALAAYRTLTAKRDKGQKLDAKEEQQLLDAEQALGQKLAFDMEGVKGQAPATVKESLTVPPPAFGSTRRAVQDEMMRTGEVDRSGQISLLSSAVTPEQDSEYLAAVKSGDIETAQRMVDEAAKKAGYKFNTQKLIADVVAKVGKKRLRDVANEIGYVGDGSMDDAGVVELAAMQLAHENSIVFKYGDPVTYDADGNVIPLSQRFNPEQDSILYSSAVHWPRNLYAYDYRTESDRGAVKHIVRAYNERTGLKEDRKFDTFPEAKAEMDRLDDLASPVLLSSAPENDPVQVALSKIHPIYGEVFLAVEAGLTPDEIMKKFPQVTSERAIGNILKEVQSRIAITTKASAGTLKPETNEEGQFINARPDLAQGGNAEFSAIDQERNKYGVVPGDYSREEVRQRARARVDANLEGEWARLEQMARDRVAPVDEDVAMSEHIFNKVSMSLDMMDRSVRERLANLRVSYRNEGTIQSHAFSMRIDQNHTPAERNALALNSLLFEPSPQVRSRMNSADPKTREAILKQWMDQIDAFKAEMKADGIDIEASLAAWHAHKQAVEQAEQIHAGTKAAMDEAMMKLSEPEKTVIRMLRDGSNFRVISSTTGYKEAELVKIHQSYQAAWLEAVRKAGKKFAENTLASSSPQDIYMMVLRELGWRSLDEVNDFAPDFIEKQNARIKDAKARERKRKELSPPKIPTLTPKQQEALDSAWERFKAAPLSTWNTLFQTEEKNLAPMVGQTAFQQWKGEILKPWRDLWQTEMEAITDPAGRISFEQWIAKPQTTWSAKQTELFERERLPINETRGTFDVNNPAVMAEIMNEWARRNGTWINKLTEFYKMAILSGPQTMLVNASGGLYAGYDATVKRATEAAWNGLLGMFGAGDVRSATFSEFLPMLKNVRAAASLAARNAIESWKLQSPVFDSYASAKPIQLDFTGVGPEYSPPATTSAISRFLRNITFRELTAVDEFWKGMFAQLDAAALAHRIAAKEEGLSGKAYADRVEALMKPGSLAWQRTIARTRRATFQDQLAYGRWTDADERANPDHKAGTPMTWQQALKKSETESAWTILDAISAKAMEARKTPFFGPLLHMFALPFIATPKNMIQRGLEVTPLGLVVDLIDGMRSLRRRVYSGKITKEESNRIAAELYNKTRFIQLLTNQTMGAMIWLAVESMTGGDDDDEYGRPVITGTLPFSATKKGERDTAQAVMPPQSIRIGETIIPYGRIEPFATALSAIVDIVASSKRNDGYNAQVVTDSVVGLKEQFKDKLFLKGLGDILRVVENPDRGADRLVAGWITGFIPNFARQPIRELDKTTRDTNPQADDGFFTAVGKRVGYSVAPQLAPAKMDVWGNPIPSNRGELIGGNTVTDSLFRIFDPFNVRKGGEIRPIDAWIFHYNMNQPDSSQRIGIEPLGDEVTVNVPGESKPRKIALTAQEHADAIRRIGQAAQSFLGDEWDWKTATAADASQRADVIKDTFTTLKRQETERLKIQKRSEITK